MKLVFLPGLDGTGLFFRTILSFLDQDNIQVIALPTTGDQSYKTLTKHIRKKLPEEDFILVAESFSGPIGVNLARMNLTHLKSIIFVATFMSTPNKIGLALFSKLPIKHLVSLPFSSFFLRKILLGNKATKKDIELFRETLLSLPSKTIRQRLESIQSLRPENFCSDIPAYYILATQDYLVPPSKRGEFEVRFNEINIKKVEGPHMILQSRAEKCADIINAITHNKKAT